MHINDIHIKNQNNRNFYNTKNIYNFDERSDRMIITLEQAKAMMTPEAIENLKQVVISHPNINVERKANCDILMQALCRAVVDEVVFHDLVTGRHIQTGNQRSPSCQRMQSL